MSLRERLEEGARGGAISPSVLLQHFGFKENPFPPSSQTSNNPHFPTLANDLIDQRIAAFVRDHRSQVVVVEGTQGVGKTNLLNYYEHELEEVLSELNTGYYVVRYLADPEASFDSTLRRLLQEFTIDRLLDLGKAISQDASLVEEVRGREMRLALTKLSSAYGRGADTAKNTCEALGEWLQGLRILNKHRDALGVQFRLDTLESRTLAFRDLVTICSKAGLLSGMFLLMDELEKQGGTLGATQVVRYLSALRAVIDALPTQLFMLLAITPDALRRYSIALPAFRSRLQDKVELHPLTTQDAALELAHFYVGIARDRVKGQPGRHGAQTIIPDQELVATFAKLLKRSREQGGSGLPHREYLHELHTIAEGRIQALNAL